MNRIILLMIIACVICAVIPGCRRADKNDGTPDNTGVPVLSPNPSVDNIQSLPVIMDPATDPIKDMVDGMTLDEKIGQMVISGIDGYKLDEYYKKMITDYHVGGFILMGRNVKGAGQLLELINSLKTANSVNKVPLFLSIDEEGGRVSRMPAQIRKLPSSRSVASVNSSEFSFKVGSIISYELNAFGLNMNFAPVLDINSNPENPVIGDRSFGSNPDIVTRLGIETMKGIKSGNVIPVVKHFPGHGDTSADSHVGLPSVSNDLARLNSFELIPFGQAIKNGADVVMTAHILLPQIDSRHPASLSKEIITGILRRDLDFDGVVITDDMTMGAITENYSIGDAAVGAVDAGSDIVLVCHGYHNQIAVMDAIKKAVHNGIISEVRIDESVYRILRLKNQYCISDNTIASVDTETINTKITEILKTYMKE